MNFAVLLALLSFGHLVSSQQSWSSQPSSGAYTSRQYQSQDAFGRASFGYTHPGQSADAYLDPYGNQVGSYAYIDPEGKEVRVSYVADEKGFRIVPNKAGARHAVLTSDGLPQDTPEVAAARAAHLAALASARAQSAAAKDQVPLQQSWEVQQQTSDDSRDQINFSSPTRSRTISARQQDWIPAASETRAVQNSKEDFLRSFLMAAARAFEQTEA